MVDVNCLGLLYCTHAALPMQQREGGHIVNVSSVAGRQADLGSAVYNMTKWGVAGSQRRRQEALHSNIRVTVVEPGFVATSSTAQRAPRGGRGVEKMRRRSGMCSRPRTSRTRSPSSRDRSEWTSTRSDPADAPAAVTTSARQAYVIAYGVPHGDDDRAAAGRERVRAEHGRPRCVSGPVRRWVCRCETSQSAPASAPDASQVERGETSPTLAVAERIAAGLER